MLSVFLFKNRKVLSFVLLLCISFTFMAVTTTKFVLNIKSIFMTIIYPFEYVINGALSFFKKIWKGIGRIEVISKELTETRKRLQKYESVSGDLKKLMTENKRLRRLLKEKEKITYEHILAQVVSKDPQNLFQSVIINKGSSDGVKPSMPVVAYRDGVLGIVGKVVETTPYIAKVVTIRDARFYIGSLLEASRYYGLVRGRGMSRTCNLEYVDINAPIKQGDSVVTSGHSDIFPKGLSIGKITYVSRERGRFFLKAYLIPTVNLAQLEDVYIIKKLPSKALEKLQKGKR